MNRFLLSTVASAAGFALTASAALGAPPATNAHSVAPSATNAPQTAGDAKPVELLEAAAQRLRDAIHVLANAPAGAERTRAMHDGNRALMEVDEAMAALPPGMLTAQADEPAYRQAVDRLEQAAQRLRDAAHALAADQNSPRRNDSIKEVNRALRETQQAMIDIPPNAWPSRGGAVSAR